MRRARIDGIASTIGLSPDGGRLVAIDGDRLVLTERHGTSLAMVTQIDAPNLEAVVWSADGQAIATRTDYAIHLRSSSDLAVLREVRYRASAFATTKDAILATSFGTAVLVAFTLDALEERLVADLEEGRPETRKPGEVVTDRSIRVSAIVADVAGRRALVVDAGGDGENGYGVQTSTIERAITLVDTTSGAIVAQRLGAFGFGAYDPWRTRFLVATNDRLEAWPVDGGAAQAIALPVDVLAVAATAGGLVTCSRATLDVWDASSLARVASTPHTAGAKRTPTALRATPDGELVFAEDEEGALFVWPVGA